MFAYSAPPPLVAARKFLPILVAGLGTALSFQAAHALGLGAATTSSRIGGPLRIEIPLQTTDADNVDVSCMRLVGQSASHYDETPWLTKGTLSIEHDTRGDFLVIKARPTNQPAIMVGVRVECGMVFRRDYTLLLDPPAVSDSIQSPRTIDLPVVPTPTAGAPRPVAGASGSTWQVNQGDSADNIADRLVPGKRSTRRAMARAILARNASLLGDQTDTSATLPTGVALSLPPISSLDKPQLPERTANPETPRPPRPAASSRRAAPRLVVTHDRLIVSGGGDMPLRMSATLGEYREATDEQRSHMRQEAELIAALDEKNASQVELKERLRQLEALQVRLKEEAARIDTELKHIQSAQSAPADATTAPLTIRTAVLASAPSVGHAQAKSSAARTANPQKGNPSPWYASTLFLGGVLLLLAAGIGILLRTVRKRSAAEAKPEHAQVQQPDTPATHEEHEEVSEHLIDPLSEEDIWPDQEGHAPRMPLHAKATTEGALGQFSSSGLGPTSLLQMVENDVEEHDSAVELAEIMMSFGRVHGAAQTLADYIRSNPKQAVKPWLKLLEVYKVAGMRTEFDALTSQLNKTFNVKPVAWDHFEIASKSGDTLEAMPHIMEKVDALWGTRECQAYLHGLLRDNRDGTRQGFPVGVVEDILMLLGVLENDLGPYRPEHSAGGQIMHSTVGLFTSAMLIPPAAAGNPATISTAPTGEATPAPAPAKPTPARPALTPADMANSLQQLDFELDMDDLTKTLHLNLDELPDDENFKQTDSI